MYYDFRVKIPDEKPNYMNVPVAIRKLEKIEMIKQADGVYRLDHAVIYSYSSHVRMLKANLPYLLECFRPNIR